MKIFDLHCDSVQNKEEGRKLINSINFSKEFPQYQVFALFVNNALEAQRQKVFDYIDQLNEDFDGIIIKSKADFERAKSEFRSGLISLEGMAFVDSTALLETLYDKGVRMLIPSWNNSNRLCASNLTNGTDKDYGLTDFGKAILSRALELGMILDVSHISDNAFDDICKLSDKPFIASHSNSRSVCGHTRNLRDDQIKEIIKRGGIIGLNLFPPFISANDNFDDIYRHIDHIIELGGENALAFGFDIDGTDGLYFNEIPRFASIHDFMIDKLSDRYPLSLVEKIAYINAEVFFQNNFC